MSRSLTVAGSTRSRVVLARSLGGAAVSFLFCLTALVGCAAQTDDEVPLTEPIDESNDATPDAGHHEPAAPSTNTNTNTDDSSSSGGTGSESSGIGGAPEEGTGATTDPGSGGAKSVPEVNQGPEDVAGACAESPTFRVEYQQSNVGNQVAFQLRFYNLTGEDVALDELVFRYYFTDEESAKWNKFVYDAKLEQEYVNLQSPMTTANVVATSEALTEADTYIQLNVASSDPIAAADEGDLAGSTYGVFSVSLQPEKYDVPNQVQDDDYSFDASKTAYTEWDHIVVYRGDELVFGCVPPAE